VEDLVESLTRGQLRLGTTSTAELDAREERQEERLKLREDVAKEREKLREERGR
jgi:hypothetical protein